MAKKRTPAPDREPKLVHVPTVFITDSLHFETVYLGLRLTDTFQLVEKKEQLIRSAMQCIDSAVTDDAEMGMVRRQCALYDIKIDPDKVKARVELKERLAELGEQRKMLEALIPAVKEASDAPRTFTPEEFELFPTDLVRVVLASLNGKAVRFENLGATHPIEPIETSDPRLVAALIRHQLGHPVVIE